MGEEKTENPPIDQAAEAVGDAMMVTQAMLLKVVVDNPHIYNSSNTKEREQLLQNESAIRCREGCCFAIYFLSQKYSQLFEAMILLETRDNEDKPKGKLKNYSLFHSYFIVKDKQGIWFAGSPANYNPSGDSDPLTTVFRSPNPQEIVDQITELDGGEWPNGEFISKSLENPSYMPPSLGEMERFHKIVPALKVFKIENDLGENKTEVFSEYLKTTET